MHILTLLGNITPDFGDCQEEHSTMVEPGIPFEEALKILAGIIAERHLRSQSGDGESVPPEPKPLPNHSIEHDIDQMET